MTVGLLTPCGTRYPLNTVSSDNSLPIPTDNGFSLKDSLTHFFKYVASFNISEVMGEFNEGIKQYSCSYKLF